MWPSRLNFTLFGGVTCLLFLVVLSQEDVKTCREDSPVNQINSLPRRNINGDEVSNNLGSYTFLVAKGTEDCTNDFCVAGDLTALSEDPQLAYDQGFASENPNSIINYAQSIIFFVGVGLFFALLVAICGPPTCCVKLCCVARANKNRKLYGDGANIYTRRSIVCTYFLLVLFIITMITLIGVSQVQGNAGLVEVANAVVDAPDATAELAQGLPDPFIFLFTSLLGRSISGVVVRVKTVVDETVNFTRLHNTFDCGRNIIGTFNSSTIDFFLDEIDRYELAVNNSVPDSGGLLETVQNETRNIVQAANDTVTVLETLRDGFVDMNLSSVEAVINDTSQSISDTIPTLQSIRQNLQAYSGIEQVTLDTVTAIEVLLTTLTNQGNADNFTSAVANLNNGLATLPDESDIASDLTTLQTINSQINVTTKTFLDELVRVQSVVDSLPTTQELNASLNALVTAIDEFDLDAIEADLFNITGKILQLPSTTAARNKIEEVIGLEEEVDCLLNITDIIGRVNASLYEIDASTDTQFKNAVEDIRKLYDGVLNETLGVLDLLDNFTEESGLGQVLDDLEATFNQTLNDAKDQLDVAKQSIIIVQDRLDIVDDNQLNTSDLISRVTSLRDALLSNDLEVTQNQLDKISATDRSALILAAGELTTIQAEIQALSPWGNQNCPNGDLCYDSTSLATPVVDVVEDFWTACTAVPLEECAYPHERLRFQRIALQLFLEQFLNQTVNIEGDVIPAIDFVLTNMNETTTFLDEAFSQVKDLQLLDTQISGDLSSIADARDDLNLLNTDIASLLNFDGADFSSFQDEFDQIRGSITDVNQTLGTLFDTITDISDAEERVFEFITVDFDELLVNISRSNLQSIVNTDGVEGLVQFLADQVNITSSAFLDLASVLTNSEPGSVLPQDIVDTALEYAGTIDLARDSDNKLISQGSIYYFLAVATSIDGVGISFKVDAALFTGFSKPTPFGNIENGKLVSYEDPDLLCATDACIENLINYYNEESLETLSDGQLPVAYNRETLMATPFAFPAIVVVIAIATFCLPKCGNLLLCCSMCCSPFIFLFYGALLFPVVVLVGDGCAGMEAVGINLVGVIQPSQCESSLGGISDANGFCNVNVSIPGYLEDTIQIDGPEILRSVLLGCEGSSTANTDGNSPVEPLKALYDVFGEKAAETIGDKLRENVAELEDSAGVSLRQPLLDAILLAENDLALDVTDFAADLNNALGCEDISSSFAGFKDAVCCDFMYFFYYSVAGWYTMAFAFLCCGCPAGALAPSRLRKVKESRAQVAEFFGEGADRFAQTRVGQAVSPYIARAGSAVGRRGKGKGRGDDPQEISPRVQEAIPVDNEFDDEIDTTSSKDSALKKMI